MGVLLFVMASVMRRLVGVSVRGMVVSILFLYTGYVGGLDLV